MTTTTCDAQLADRVSADLVRVSQALYRAEARLSASLAAGLARDVIAGGPVSDMLLSHSAADTPFFGARALASVNQLRFLGEAPELHAYVLASLAHLRGDTEERAFQRAERDRGYQEAWSLARDVLLAHPDHMLSALDRPIRPNFAAMSAQLLTGLVMLGSRRVRLLEIGACAGLNLLLDRYSWFGPDWEWGNPDSALRLRAACPGPGRIEVFYRAGCDQNPYDPSSPGAVMLLHSYIPLEFTVNHQALDEALQIAARNPVNIEQAVPSEWLRRKLIDGADPSVTTVVWHGEAWGDLDPDEQNKIESIFVLAGKRAPVARIACEPTVAGAAPALQVSLYSTGD